MDEFWQALLPASARPDGPPYRDRYGAAMPLPSARLPLPR